jgi:hypothetical protein
MRNFVRVEGASLVSSGFEIRDSIDTYGETVLVSGVERSEELHQNPML